MELREILMKFVLCQVFFIFSIINNTGKNTILLQGTLCFILTQNTYLFIKIKRNSIE